jgi:hypothetical protein
MEDLRIIPGLEDLLYFSTFGNDISHSLSLGYNGYYGDLSRNIDGSTTQL